MLQRCLWAVLTYTVILIANSNLLLKFNPNSNRNIKRNQWFPGGATHNCDFGTAVLFNLRTLLTTPFCTADNVTCGKYISC